VEGIKFYTLYENRTVINYPKPHYDFGVSKNSSANGRYKPSVRIFKNARTFLVNQGAIAVGLAPSYFLECLIYNVPDELFSSSYQETFIEALNWLNLADLNGFVCQNEQIPLFGSSPEQWSVSDAQELINELIYLWNHW
jgi:hypothetical protein